MRPSPVSCSSQAMVWMQMVLRMPPGTLSSMSGMVPAVATQLLILTRKLSPTQATKHAQIGCACRAWAAGRRCSLRAWGKA